MMPKPPGLCTLGPMQLEDTGVAVEDEALNSESLGPKLLSLSPKDLGFRV